jgi:hypothetical protein
MEFDTDDFKDKFLTVKGDVETFQGQERFRPSSFKSLATAADPAVTEAAPAAEAAPAPAPAAPAKPAPAAAKPAPAAPKPAPAPAGRRPI